jgi:microcystin-dependent protein
MYSYNPGGDGTWTPDEGAYLVDSVSDNKNTWWARLAMGYAGGGAAHNNMPPYLVVNMWKRTS